MVGQIQANLSIDKCFRTESKTSKHFTMTMMKDLGHAQWVNFPYTINARVLQIPLLHGFIFSYGMVFQVFSSFNH